MKITIGINTLTAIEQPVYANHIQFFFRLGRNFPEDQFLINTPRRMSIDRMRNMTAKAALEWESDYLMFIDDDVVIPIDCLRRLIGCGADIAAGRTIIRGYPFHNMSFRYDGQNLRNVRDDEMGDEILPVDAVGFSCALIRCSLLKKLPQPWFVTGTHNTEDIYFCVKARHFFPATTIVVDPLVKTAHALGTEYIDPGNKKAYTEYFLKAFPPEPEPPADRGDAYFEKVDAL